MKSKSFRVLFLMCLLPLNAFCQETLKTGLNIGDTIPDIMVNGVIGRADSAMRIKQLYHNKVLIINFWATWCVPCVEEMGKLDSLKVKYDNQLNILSVSHDKPELINLFLAKHREINTNHLAITSDDHSLTALFNHKYLPHNIWINGQGIVVAITDDIDLSEKNIKIMLEGKKLNLDVKKDDNSFSFLKPLQVKDSLLSYRSLITGYKKELNSGNVTYQFNWRRFFGWNLNITDFFWLAYTQQLSQTINWNAIELHTKDSVKFYYPKQNRGLFSHSAYNSTADFNEQVRFWERKNLYCYELRLPGPVDGDTFRTDMFEDLERFFKVHASIEIRNKVCSVIQIAKTTNAKKMIGPSVAKPFILNSPGEIKCQNVTLSQFLLSLNDLIDGNTELFVDKTHIGQNVVIDLHFDKNKPLTMEYLKGELTKHYGLKFTREKVNYPVLVITDLN